MLNPRSAGSLLRESRSRFEGFALPTSNTLYCPNQFFDVCLPNCSRGCVRLVAYMLRRTLGWCDAEGRPLKERFTITYREIEREAGVSRQMIKPALDEAIGGRFIRCLQGPKAKALHQASSSGRYELQWDEQGAFTRDPAQFRGFFAGDGNRTYIPNQFFDVVVRNEPLAVAKVVGSIIRFSIGFQTKWGHRRQQAAMSYRQIQNYVRIGDRKTLAAALKHAMSSKYLVCVEAGRFDPDGGRQSKSATYALRWLSEAAAASIGPKTPPANMPDSDRSKIPTAIGLKTPPADRSKIPTDIQITGRNNIPKQSEGAAAASFEKLIEVGFDPTAANSIASSYPIERILNQIDWLDRRTATKNRLGLLRRAIEKDWSPPGKGAGQLGDTPSATDPLAAQRAALTRHFQSPFTP